MGQDVAGIVEDIGEKVKNVQKGDHVVGKCEIKYRKFVHGFKLKVNVSRDWKN